MSFWFVGPVMRWAAKVGGPPSLRGAAPFREVRFEWVSPRRASAVSEALRAAVTPRGERLRAAVAASALLDLDTYTISGHVRGSDFRLGAQAGIRTPWRQHLRGTVYDVAPGSRIVATLSPSWAPALVLTGAAGLLALAFLSLLIAAAVLAIPSPHRAGAALAYSFVPLFFGSFSLLLARWSARLGTRQGEHLLTVVDRIAGALGASGRSPAAPD